MAACFFDRSIGYPTLNRETKKDGHLDTLDEVAVPKEHWRMDVFD